MHEQSRASVVRGLPKQKFANIAFTLAEVLVTLAIIGVVAALTIPTVINNYQKDVTVTKLKKVYSQLNQAIQLASIDYGSPKTWDYCELGGGVVTRKFIFEKYLKPYLKVTKEYPAKSGGYGNYKWLNGDVVTAGNGYMAHGHNHGFDLADGTYISFESCGTKGNFQGAYFNVDINGFNNPPNVAGKDFFCMRLFKSEGKLLPLRVEQTDSDLNSTCDKASVSATAGDACFAKIMRDGWEIKYDW